MHLGPCGMPWNYEDYYIFVLPHRDGIFHLGDFAVKNRFDDAINDHIKVLSGIITVNRDGGTCSIDVVLEEKTSENPLTYVTARIKFSGSVTEGW